MTELPRGKKGGVPLRDSWKLCTLMFEGADGLSSSGRPFLQECFTCPHVRWVDLEKQHHISTVRTFMHKICKNLRGV